MATHTSARAVEGVRGSRLPAGRDVSMRERQRLFDACAADPIPARGARDAAMLGLLAGTGVRRAEVVALDFEHVREDGAVRVLGKGGECQGSCRFESALQLRASARLG